MKPVEMAEKQRAFIIAQMHAIALAIAEKAAIGT